MKPEPSDEFSKSIAVAQVSGFVMEDPVNITPQMIVKTEESDVDHSSVTVPGRPNVSENQISKSGGKINYQRFCSDTQGQTRSDMDPKAIVRHIPCYAKRSLDRFRIRQVPFPLILLIGNSVLRGVKMKVIHRRLLEMVRVRHRRFGVHFWLRQIWLAI